MNNAFGRGASPSEVENLAGYKVGQCLIDRALSLHLLSGQQSSLLRIEGKFRLGLDQEWELDPSNGPSSLCPSLALLDRTIESAKLVRTGELEIVLSGGAWLLLYKGNDYEAWTLSLPDNTLVVSGVDGAVSVFPGKGRSTA